VKTNTRRFNPLVALLLCLAFVAGLGAARLGESRAAASRFASHLAQVLPGVYEVQKAGGIPPSGDLKPLQTFWEAREKVLNNYLHPITPEEERKMIDGAVQGMLRALGDPYTAYMPKKEYDEFNKENLGHFEGIGAVLDERTDEETGDKYVLIESLIPNHPADKAGIRPGDIILKVDGQSIRNFGVLRARDLIRGPRGTTVKLTVKRGDQIKEISVVRQQVDLPTVEVRMFPNGVGYIWLLQFNRRADRKLRDAYDELMHGVGVILQDATRGEGNTGEKFVAVEAVVKGMPGEREGLEKFDEILEVGGKSVSGKTAAEVTAMLRRGEPGSPVKIKVKPREKEAREVTVHRSTGIKGLLFDLSSDPGGLLEMAVRVAGLFIDGPVVHVLERGGRQTTLDAPSRPKFPTDMPVVVLVNKYSASASEIVAGALQDAHRGIICGQKTFGKAKVQSILELSDGSALRITTAKYLTRAKHDISNDGSKGVHPDKVFPWPELQADDKYDPKQLHEEQIQLALKVLRENMAAAGKPGRGQG